MGTPRQWWERTFSRVCFVKKLGHEKNESGERKRSHRQTQKIIGSGDTRVGMKPKKEGHARIEVNDVVDMASCV